MRLAAAFLLALSFAATAAALDTVSVTRIGDVAREEGLVPATFRISRGGAFTGALTVNYTLGGSATNGADYAALGGTATIADGHAYVDVVVTPLQDATVELREDVLLTISHSASYSRDTAYFATIVIADNDLRLSWTPLRTTASEVLEGAYAEEGAMRVTLSAVVPYGRLLEIRYQLLDGDTAADLNNDYVMTLMHRASNSSSSILDSRSVGRDDDTGAWDVAGAVVGAAGAAEGEFVIPVPEAFSRFNIRPGDVITFGVTTEPAYVVEAVDDVEITIYDGLKEDVAADALVRNFFEATITANGDIQGVYLSGYDIGESHRALDIAITPDNDTRIEGAESVTMRLLSSPDYVIDDPTDGRLTIADINLIVSVAAVKDAFESPVTNGTIRLNLSGPAPRNLNIPVTLSGTASEGADYTSLGGEVLVPQGATGVDIPIVPASDVDTDPETVVLELVDTEDVVLAGSGATSGSVATINIRSGSPPASYGTVAVSGTRNAAEAGLVSGSFTVTATRSGTTNPDLVVPMVFSGAAIPDVDYTALASSVILPELRVTELIPTGSGYLRVNLATQTTPITLPSGSVLRVGNGMTVRLDAPATVGTDPTYLDLASLLASAVSAGTSVGVNSVTISITPLSDSLTEGNESVGVTLTQPADAIFQVGTPSSASILISEAAVVTPDPGDDGGSTSGSKPPVGSGSDAGGSSGCGAGAASALLMGAFAVVALRRRRR